MNNSGNFAEKWQSAMHAMHVDEVLQEENIQPKTGLEKTKRVLRIVGKVIYHLRKLFMAFPVVYYALQLASYNASNLPEMVGLSIQANGTYAQMITRSMAVNGPLVVTGACLATMFLSRKTVYPWLISIFSLIIPIVIWFTNVYPC